MLKLIDLVVGDGAATWLDNVRFIADMNDRLPANETDEISPIHFGQIAGDLVIRNDRAEIIGRMGYLLTPIAVQ
jgi:hypothetical protein